MARRQLIRAFAASALLLGVGGALAPASGFAQDATPSMMQEAAAHPAHIHAGSCPDVGDVVFPLQDITARDMMGTPSAGMSEQASPMAGSDDYGTPMAGKAERNINWDEVVAMSTTVVQAPLSDILSADHAINVHESAEKIQNYIACGDITGTPENGTLEIALDERNNSGVEGEAYLTDNGDNTTTVEVLLMQASGNGMTEASATPAG
ncbi:MAG: hypothetical protein U0075_13510 [Thermomicrobiales bacterium]